MALDRTLASLHHLAIFSLAAILAAELAMISGEMKAPAILRLARVDAWYGAVAALVLAAGVARVFLGDKGAQYYGANHLFWTKMLLFAAVGAISAWPTLRYVVWRREARRNHTFVPTPREIAGVKRALWIEAGLFALIPIAAAGMARGFGLHG